MSDITDVTIVDSDRARQLKTVGWVSYVLHLIVAIGALIPGAQAGTVLLIIALVVDWVNRSKADGTWQQAIFRGVSAP